VDNKEVMDIPYDILDSELGVGVFWSFILFVILMGIFSCERRIGYFYLSQLLPSRFLLGTIRVFVKMGDVY